MRVNPWTVLLVGIVGIGWSFPVLAGSCIEGRVAYFEARELGPERADPQESLDLLRACLDRSNQKRNYSVQDAEDLLLMADASVRWANQTLGRDAYLEAWRWLNALTAIPGLPASLKSRALELRAWWHQDAPKEVYARLEASGVSRQALCRSRDVSRSGACTEKRADAALADVREARTLSHQARDRRGEWNARYREAFIQLNDQAHAGEALSKLHGIVREYQAAPDPRLTPVVVRSLLTLQNYPSECRAYGGSETACLTLAMAELQRLTDAERAEEPGIRRELEAQVAWDLAYQRIDRSTSNVDGYRQGMQFMRDLLAQHDALEEAAMDERRDLSLPRLDAALQVSSSLLLAPAALRKSAMELFGFSDERQMLEQVRAWLEPERAEAEDLEWRRASLLAVADLRLASLRCGTDAAQASKLVQRAGELIVQLPDPGDAAMRDRLEKGYVRVDPATVLMVEYARGFYFHWLSRLPEQASRKSLYEATFARARKGISFYLEHPDEQLRTYLQQKRIVPELGQRFNEDIARECGRRG